MNTKPHVRSMTTIVLAVLLSACRTAVPPPATLPAEPTQTPPPTRTAPPPTATPVPATPTPVPPTATPAPPTATPRPTFTPTPGPGDILYSTQFDDFAGWHAAPLQPQGKMSTAIQDGQLVVTIKSPNTYGYAFYRGDYSASSDQTIEVTAQRIGGTNRNNLSLVCRASSLGWYEFSITSGGLYNIMVYNGNTGRYKMLASGGSAAINLQDKPNKLKAVCQGDRLTLVVNDQTLATAQDGFLADGDLFGLSVSTFDIGNVSVAFDYLTVRLPAPADALAPTPKPAAGGGTGSQTGSAAGYDGTWSGTTSQGQSVMFTIENNTITLVMIGFNCMMSTNDLTIDSPVGGAVRSASFDVTLFDGSRVTGTFASGKSASGTIRCNAQSFPWTAAR